MYVGTRFEIVYGLSVSRSQSLQIACEFENIYIGPTKLTVIIKGSVNNMQDVILYLCIYANIFCIAVFM